LLEHLGSYESSAGDPTLRRLAGEERSLNRIAALTRTLEQLDESEIGSEKQTRLETTIDGLRGEYERGLRDAAAGSAGGSAQILGKVPVTAAEVVAILRSDEAILEYLIGPERVHAFLVTPAGVRHQVLAVTPADLASRIRLGGLLSRPGDAASTQAPLAALHQSLLGDFGSITEWRSARVVHVVPHGVTGLAPFAALRDSQTGRYLVEDHAIATMASAATLIALRRSTPAATGERIAAFAPFPGSLPGTSEEIERIGRTSRRVDPSRGRAATESAIRRAMTEGPVIHLASHGRLNPDNPLFSRMELYPGSDTGPGGDGRLEAHEILGLRLKSPLVYLSGCETGLAPAAITPAGRGEEYVSLAQAFLYAGAAGVVATMWRIPDSGSVPLVEAFYRALDAGGPLIGLAQANEILKRSVRTHPYYWAGHHSGDRRAGTTCSCIESN
jgi:CHAT domain-containing protein